MAALLSVIAIGAVTYAGWRVFRGPQPTPATGSATPVHLPAALAARPTRVITFEEGCEQAECHAQLARAPVQHAAVAIGRCDVCHAPDSGGHRYSVGTPKDGVCSSCHVTDEHRIHQHRAMSDDGCLACHSPHSSTSKGLLKAGSVGDTCAQCHPRTNAPSPHKPYALNQCDACHEPHGSDHANLLFGGEGPDHCRQCHANVVDAVETSSYSHCNIEGGCLACHGAHGGDQKHLLRAEPRDLCVTCHPAVGAAVTGATVSHDAVLKGEQCVTCHDPHASNRPKMLRDAQMTVCLSCHAKPLTAADGRAIPAMADALRNSPVVHGAIEHGDCSGCHTMHGGEHAKLLKGVPGTALGGSHDVRNFALCFACHDPKLIESSGTTQFRDGGRNLHEVHLKSDGKAGTPSRGCASCHTAHGGSLPRLIATTVNFQGSGWAMPMKFELTADGGSCAPGCHEKLAYRRSAADEVPPTDGHTDSNKGRAP